MNHTSFVVVFSGNISNTNQLLCDARELHKVLQVKSRFNDWISNRIAEYGFIENQDFVIATKNLVAKRGGHNRLNYHLTLDTAKELAMVEKTEVGRAIRRYFIDCERRAISGSQPIQQPLPLAETTIPQEYFAHLAKMVGYAKIAEHYQKIICKDPNGAEAKKIYNLLLSSTNVNETGFMFVFKPNITNDIQAAYDYLHTQTKI